MQGSARPDRRLLDAGALCAHLVPKGSIYAFLAEHRSRLFPPQMFDDLFPSGRGRPSVPAEVIATTMVLQALEGLSDRQAVRQLETNIAWKAAAGLALDAEAFHSTVLVLWRNKLRASERPQRIFDTVRQVVEHSGVLTTKTRRALDSTVLDDAVQRQDTITLLVSAIRRVRKLVPELVEVWVRQYNLEGGRPPCDWDDHDDVDRVVSELVDDAYELIWAAEDRHLVLDEAQADALALLALVAGQDVEPAERPGTWKIAKGTAPDRIVSVVDPESRHAHKSAYSYRDGFKAHVAAEPETGIVTATDLTAGNTADADAAPGLLAAEPAGTEVLGDSAYSAGQFRHHLGDRQMEPVIKPMPLRPAIDGGFTLDDFDVCEREGTVTCPAGVTVTVSPGRRANFGTHCQTCPDRRRCTRSKSGRIIVLHPHHRLLVAARAQAQTDQFDATYRQHRPMIERTIAWLTRGTNRKLRYRGIERNRLWLAHRAAAVNLTRLVNLGLTHDGTTWAITTS
jgi:IS5 family transposase